MSMRAHLSNALGFKPRQHFDSGQLAKCERCELLGDNSWPKGWVLGHDGIVCPWCAFPGADWLQEKPR